PTWRSDAASGLDGRYAAGLFPGALRDSAPSAAPAPHRREREECFRDGVTSSSQATRSRSGGADCFAVSERAAQYNISKSKFAISMIPVTPATESTNASLASW